MLKNSKSLLIQPKSISLVFIAIGLLLYLAGTKLPFILILWTCFTVFLPMPKIIDSWLSRVVLGLFFLFSVLQLSAVFQFLIHPAGKFNLIATITALLTALVVLIFGSSRPVNKLRILSSKDVFAVISCLLLLVPFAPIVVGNHSIERIAKIGSVQIVDATVHYDAISGAAVVQNLDYGGGKYYPRGFHYATGFVEDGLYGSPRALSWKANAWLYFGHFIFFSMLLIYILIFAGYSVLSLIDPTDNNKVALFTTAVTIGLGTIVMHQLLFMSEGFLNYYYICAAVIAGALYVLDSSRQEFNEISSNKLADKWPIVAFLLITLGVSFSWPLFVPALLLTVLLWALPATKLSDTPTKLFKQIFKLANLAIVVMILLHLIAIYMQLYYVKGGESSINLTANGAVTSFNAVFLLLGLGGVLILLFSDELKTLDKKRLLAIVLPYLVLITGLMLFQFFVLGEARYYLIKSSLLLEMILLFILCATVVRYLQATKLNGLYIFMIAPIITSFAILASIGTLAQPLHEVRSMFRDYSNIGRPPFYSNDVPLISKLGEEGKLEHFNVTVLHYNIPTDRYIAHMQIAQWANSMGNKILGEKATCFGNLYSALAYQYNDSPGQPYVIEQVKDCAAIAHQKGIDYYIVTDKASVPKLSSVFGKQVTLAY